jgi:hypothetical protein
MAHHLRNSRGDSAVVRAAPAKRRIIGQAQAERRRSRDGL